MANSWESVQAVIADILDDIDSGAARILNTVQQEIPAYMSIQTPELRPHAKKVIERVLTAINERRAPSEKEIADLVAVAAQRARQHLAVEEVIQGFQLTVRTIWQLFTEKALAHRVEASLLVEAAELFWHWIDAVTLPVAQVHRSAEMEMVRHDQAQRQHFLNGILYGSIAGTELISQATGYGLNPDLAYVSFRGRLFGTDSIEDMQYRMASDNAIVLSGLVERDFAGLALRRPSWQEPDGAIGIGPAATLRSMSSAFVQATRALETAMKFRLAGIYEIGDLPLQAGILADEVVGETLWYRFVELPGERARQRQILLNTLASFLDNDRDIERTASVLRVHTNTVRNRLNRFKEITGAQLSRTEDLFSVWWALQYDSIRNPELEKPSSNGDKTDSPAPPDGEFKSKTRKRSGKRPKTHKMKFAGGKSAR